jgi:Domain of Unknown Function (DUF1080)
MKKISFYVLALFLAFTACSEAPKKNGETAEAPKTVEEIKAMLPTLSDAEKAAGFKVLFNGLTPEGWKVYQTDSSNHWFITAGVLSTTGGHNDLITKEEFENFELIFDWKVSKGGNSGVFYMVQDEPKKYLNTYETGIEYQVIDDKGWPDKLEEGQKAGAVYDLYAPTVAAAKDAGEWNTGKIICNKGHIQHFVNDQMTADYVWNSPDYKARFAKSKFKDWDFAKKYKGHIALQDHGQAVSYRNIKIKVL